jgi:hypothetical protein
MANANGTWKTVINSPQGDQAGVLTLRSSGNSLSGSYDSAEEGTLAIENGKVDGDTLSWKMNVSIPTTMTVDCQATVTGNSLTGTVTTGPFGDFPLTGTRE